MKKMKLNLFRLKGGAGLKALAFLAFFFVWMSSVSAQYVSPNDALVIIKGEIEVLDDQAANTNNNSVLMEIRFKKGYLVSVMAAIEDGATVDDAIHNNVPIAKPAMHSSGWMYHTTGPTFRTEVGNLVTYMEQLLEE